MSEDSVLVAPDQSKAAKDSEQQLTLPLMLRLWMAVPRSRRARRRRRVMRWAVLDALCRRHRLRCVTDHLVGVLERPKDNRLTVRRAAAIALIRLHGGGSASGFSGRVQAALARGLALALPRRLGLPQVVPGLLSEAECTTLLEQAEAHASQQGWGSLHRQYPTVDITLDKLGCGSAVRQRLAASLLPLYAERFGAQYGPASSLDFRDLFIAKYDATPGAGGQRGLDGHVDASMLSMVPQRNPNPPPRSTLALTPTTTPTRCCSSTPRVASRAAAHASSTARPAASSAGRSRAVPHSSSARSSMRPLSSP